MKLTDDCQCESEEEQQQQISKKLEKKEPLKKLKKNDLKEFSGLIEKKQA